jgi:hypothetical protein
MKYIEFPQANAELAPHPDNAATVGTLPIFRQCPAHVLEVWNKDRIRQGLEPANYPEGPACVISAWQPDWMERQAMAAALANGEPITIYLQHMGYTHSPVAVWGISPWSGYVQQPTAGDVIPDEKREEDDGPEINA